MKQNQIEEFFVWDETNLIKPHNNCDDKIKNDHQDITDPKLRRKAYIKAYEKANQDKIKARKKAYREANKDKAKAYYEANQDKIKARKKAYREANKDKAKAYREANQDKIKAKDKAWRVANPDKTKAQHKAYYEANIDKIKAKAKAYYEANIDKTKAQHKAYYEANIDKKKAYREANIDKTKAQHKAYRAANRDKIKDRQNNRIKTNIQYKLSRRLRSRLYHALQGNQKTGSAVRDLGCSIDELRLYLESKFQSGMSWDNWSFEGWHIDHIKPLASFDLTDRKQLLLACHYTNLQPLWAFDNLSKGDRTQSN